MKPVLITLSVSSASFWAIFICAFFRSLSYEKKHPLPAKNKAGSKFGNVCAVVNLTGTFIVFEIFSLLISLLVKIVIAKVFLYISAYLLALYIGHRILPHINNRIVSLFIKPDGYPEQNKK